MPDEPTRRVRRDAMRQIKRKQNELLAPDGSGRWRLDVTIPVLVTQAIVVLALGLLVGIGLHVLLLVFMES